MALERLETPLKNPYINPMHGRHTFKGGARVLYHMGAPCILEAATQANPAHLLGANVALALFFMYGPSVPFWVEAITKRLYATLT